MIVTNNIYVDNVKLKKLHADIISSSLIDSW